MTGNNATQLTCDVDPGIGLQPSVSTATGPTQLQQHLTRRPCCGCRGRLSELPRVELPAVQLPKNHNQDPGIVNMDPPQPACLPPPKSVRPNVSDASTSEPCAVPAISNAQAQSSSPQPSSCIARAPAPRKVSINVHAPSTVGLRFGGLCTNSPAHGTAVLVRPVYRTGTSPLSLQWQAVQAQQGTGVWKEGAREGACAERDGEAGAMVTWLDWGGMPKPPWAA
jgi:hypothetical protein